MDDAQVSFCSSLNEDFALDVVSDCPELSFTPLFQHLCFHHTSSFSSLASLETELFLLENRQETPQTNGMAPVLWSDSSWQSERSISKS
jgi:hypothetical protein